MLCFNQRGMNHRALVSIFLMIACGVNVLFCLPAQAQVYWGHSGQCVAPRQSRQSSASHYANLGSLAVVPSLYALSANTNVSLSATQIIDNPTSIVNGGRLVTLPAHATIPSVSLDTAQLSFFEQNLPIVQQPNIVVPEPGALAFVVCLGVGGIALRRNRRRSRRVMIARTVTA